MSTFATVFSLYRERKRQLHEEGWTVEHDDLHTRDQLARAAAAYTLPPSNQGRMQLWPWSIRFYKVVPDNRIRELEKAGALLIAEIERLKRERKNNGYSARHYFGSDRSV